MKTSRAQGYPSSRAGRGPCGVCELVVSLLIMPPEYGPYTRECGPGDGTILRGQMSSCFHPSASRVKGSWSSSEGWASPLHSPQCLWGQALTFHAPQTLIMHWKAVQKATKITGHLHVSPSAKTQRALPGLHRYPEASSEGPGSFSSPSPSVPPTSRICLPRICGQSTWYEINSDLWI